VEWGYGFEEALLDSLKEDWHEDGVLEGLHHLSGVGGIFFGDLKV
jgi:hypothetical protein